MPLSKAFMLCFKRGLREMHEETRGDIDKDGRCRGVYSSVMRLYDAPFSFSMNGFYDSISWVNRDERGPRG